VSGTVWGGFPSLHSGIEIGRSRTGGAFGGKEEGDGLRSRPGAARTILRFHTIGARPSKQPPMVRTFLKPSSNFCFCKNNSKTSSSRLSIMFFLRYFYNFDVCAHSLIGSVQHPYASYIIPLFPLTSRWLFPRDPSVFSCPV
jgi:hypothetical protein